MDGEGAQYAFLDAIYHNCALILNRKWIESVDEKYQDFKEGFTTVLPSQTAKRA